MVVLAAEKTFYEGMRTTHSLYFCLYRTLVVNELMDDVENE